MSNEEFNVISDELEHRLDLLECEIHDLIETRERILDAVNAILKEYGQIE